MSSSSSTTSKLEKEKLKLVQEKCQALLNDMLRDEDNKYCVDCDAKGPRWASWNLGIFLCIRCAGIHRNLGVHISRVKSVNLDTWTPEQVVTMQQMGNSRARAVYEANMPDNFRRPQTDVALENFIRAKYEHKKYIAQEWVQPPTPKVNWDTEIEEDLRKKKEAKKQINSDGVNLSNAIPKPKPATANPTPSSKSQNPPLISNVHSAALVSSAVNSVTTEVSEKPKCPSDDLLGLMGGNDMLNTLTSSDPFASPIKAVPPSAGSNADDLGGLFTSPDSISDANAKKMTKESILSLYGQANPFSSPMFSGNQQGAAPAAANPFPQFNAQFNPNLMPNAQGGINPYINAGLGGGNAAPLVKDAGINNLFNFQPEVAQLQQQIHGMNLQAFNAGGTPVTNQGSHLIGNFNQGSLGLQGLMGSTATPNQGAVPSQVSQARNIGPFF